MKPRIIAVMPVSGREELFGKTVSRLYRQPEIDRVVCVCDTEREGDIALQNGASMLTCPSETPLGTKWQMGLELAEAFNPDAVMIVGSGNWFTDGWCETLFPYLDDYDMVGSEVMYILHFRERDKVLLRWGGYYTNSRKGDSLGAGRLLSRRILDKVDWQIYDPTLNKGLDRSMQKKLRAVGIKELTLPEGKEKLLKISSWRWPNINHYHALWNSPMCKKADETILAKYFPEAEGLRLG